MIPSQAPQPRPLPELGELDVIVIGGSAGAFQVLSRLMPSLPDTLPVVIVVHLPSGRPSPLASVLGVSSGRQTAEALDKAPLIPGLIHFAPPDYHLLLEADKSFALSVDPPVHFSRPSIDVLFESAAQAFGNRVMGVVLTGANEDGAQGLKAIHEAGGFCVVQRPDTAEAESMPLAAIDSASPDRVLSIEEMELLFQQLAVTPVRRREPGGSNA